MRLRTERSRVTLRSALRKLAHHSSEPRTLSASPPSRRSNLDILWQALSRDFATFGMWELDGCGGTKWRQSGVIRTNCVDCLDRTNVVQGLLARKALEAACRSLELLPRHDSLHAFPLVRKGWLASCVSSAPSVSLDLPASSRSWSSSSS